MSKCIEILPIHRLKLSWMIWVVEEYTVPYEFSLDVSLLYNEISELNGNYANEQIIDLIDVFYNRVKLHLGINDAR